MSRAGEPGLTESLEHVVDAIERMTRYMVGMTEQDVVDDVLTPDAVIRNLEVTGVDLSIGSGPGCFLFPGVYFMGLK